MPYEIDSLMESALCTEENRKWESYRLSVDNPNVSENSQDNIDIYKCENALDKDSGDES